MNCYHQRRVSTPHGHHHHQQNDEGGGSEEDESSQQEEPVAITRRMVLRKVGDFDVESVRHLRMRAANIGGLGELDQCVNLLRLDLSANRITDLAPLAALEQLESLNLSANSITSLAALASLKMLRQLNVAGNKIESIDCLTGLKELSQLRLCDQIVHLSNPLCRSSSYPDSVIEKLSQVNDLDGLRVRGAGSQFFRLYDQVRKGAGFGNSGGGGAETTTVKHRPNLDRQQRLARLNEHDAGHVTTTASDNFRRLLAESRRLCSEK